MPLDFLVSPQTADAEARLSTAFENAYNRDQDSFKAQQALESRERIEEDRTKAAESRAEARQKSAFQLEMQREDARRKGIEAQTGRQFTIAQASGLSKRFNDIVSTARAEVKYMAQHPEKYDPNYVDQYSQKLSRAIATDENSFSQYMGGFWDKMRTGTVKEGADPQFDFTSLQSWQLGAAPTNPLIEEKSRFAMAQAAERTRQGQERLKYAKEQLKLSGARFEARHEKVWDEFTRAQGGYHSLLAQKQAYLESIPNQNDPIVKEQVMRFDNAIASTRTSYDAASAVMHDYARRGEFGPDLQAHVDDVDPDHLDQYNNATGASPSSPAATPQQPVYNLFGSQPNPLGGQSPFDFKP